MMDTTETFKEFVINVLQNVHHVLDLQQMNAFHAKFLIRFHTI